VRSSQSLGELDVQGVVIKGSGHWLMEEAPRQLFLNSSPSSINRGNKGEGETSYTLALQGSLEESGITPLKPGKEHYSL
jgi:hypothetical protein